MSAPVNETGGASAPQPDTRIIRAQWQGEQRFDTGRPDGVVARIDGTGQSGQSPPEILLSALASCTAIDVVLILGKRRTPVATLDVEVRGRRVTTTPRRFDHVHMAFRITGEGIEREHAERAIDLSINKYCSVRDTLDPELPIEWSLALNDDPAVRTTG
jgi:putative redox protein